MPNPNREEMAREVLANVWASEDGVGQRAKARDIRNGNLQSEDHRAVAAILAAIDLERERCAKIAEEKYGTDRGWNNFYRQAGNAIAAAIRGEGGAG